MQWGERPDYENVPKEQKQFMKVEPVNFNQEHKEMLGHCKMLLERGYIAINPAFQDRKEKKGYETIDYYEAARIDYTESVFMRKHFDSPKGINNLNKYNKAL
jgi:hypothetical protein